MIPGWRDTGPRRLYAQALQRRARIHHNSGHWSQACARSSAIPPQARWPTRYTAQMRRSLSLAVLVALVSCSSPPPAPKSAPVDFNKLTNDFMYGALALSPVSATQAGYHEPTACRSTKPWTIQRGRG